MMKKIFVVAASAVMAFMLVGCAAIQPISPEVNSKLISSTNPAPKGCKYLGEVVGNQGNFFTGAWTSNENLEQGSMIDLKNKAYQLGGNYVQLITNRAGVTGSSQGGGSASGFWSSGSTQQTNVTSTGNVYKCPPASIGLA